jgi:hypothetical protein
MKLIQLIAVGVAKTPAGNVRRLRYDEMVAMARTVCESLNLSYSLTEVLELKKSTHARKQNHATPKRRSRRARMEMLLVSRRDDTGPGGR